MIAVRLEAREIDYLDKNSSNDNDKSKIESKEGRIERDAAAAASTARVRKTLVRKG
jgi:hypothetical protein